MDCDCGSFDQAPRMPYPVLFVADNPLPPPPGTAITALNFGSFITKLYALGLFLGTVYSVPPLRLKRSPVAAFVIIATVRGFLLNFGVYYATRAALGLSFAWNPAIRCGGVWVGVGCVKGGEGGGGCGVCVGWSRGFGAGARSCIEPATRCAGRGYVWGG